MHDLDGKSLARVIYKGRDAIITQQFGDMLGYSDHGGRLVFSITHEWADEFEEGKDYEILRGQDLAALKALATNLVDGHIPVLLHISIRRDAPLAAAGAVPAEHGVYR